MKKVLVPLGIASALLVGCGNNETGENLNSDLVDVGNLGEGYDLLRDRNTGCIYIYKETGYKLNMSAYYDEEGNVAGCGEESLDKTKYE